MNNNRYRAVVANTCTAAINSDAATLTIAANATITSQPSPVTACAGTNANFTIAATGAIGYQWQVSTNGGTTFTDIAGATTATLTLNAVVAGMNNNQYQVQVNGCGGGLTSTPVTLLVNEPATITTQPASQLVCAGSPASYSVTVSGTSLTYQWQVSANGGGSWNDLPGEISSTLSISTTSSMDDNRYRVVINGLCTTDLISDFATLSLEPDPAITAQPQNQAVCETGNASFSVTASNAAVYQWEISTDGGTTFSPIAGETSATLQVTGVTSAQHNNQYRVVVTGECLAVTSNPATLTVTTTPNIGINGPAGAVCAGETITLSGTGASTYTWNNGVTDGVPFTILQTTTFTVTGTATGNCSGTADITVTVNLPPVVTLSATATELEPGESSTITATANPAATAFQWFRNGQLLAGETGSKAVY